MCVCLCVWCPYERVGVFIYVCMCRATFECIHLLLSLLFLRQGLSLKLGWLGCLVNELRASACLQVLPAPCQVGPVLNNGCIYWSTGLFMPWIRQPSFSRACSMLRKSHNYSSQLLLIGWCGRLRRKLVQGRGKAGYQHSSMWGVTTNKIRIAWTCVYITLTYLHVKWLIKVFGKKIWFNNLFLLLLFSHGVISLGDQGLCYCL